MQDGFPHRRITAVLGPTNTGKTHFAIERMLAHRSGMIGFPLRLLARENYDRVVRAKGVKSAALITGEERIIPPNPAYFLCTVESMPLDRPVAFLAVDEVQLAADPERGHVFTDRVLHARGEEETMFLGADTVRRLLRKLVPEAEMVSRPRLSRLSYAGVKKITRLPPRSAVVAFSAEGVYSLADLMRRRRGGTAVVMGALSPRTRNAQVGLYQAGEVDYMVATDAIGMGLNMDVRHVAFSSLVKFDGRHPRRLTPAEIGQIAGRAGRHLQDGSFGTTGDVGPLEPEVVERIENHEFDPVRYIFWRNTDLDFQSLPRLIRSLEATPPAPFLRRARDADDYLSLRALAKQEDIAAGAAEPETVQLLWEVCQIPDFRKILADHHTRLLSQVYRHLMRSDGRLPADWVESHIRRLDRTDGEVDTLTGRIAHIRTWTYISHRPGWLDDPVHWQQRTRDIEDRLSDALHERLTNRFVDRRAATLVRRMDTGERLFAAVTRSGDVLVEGEFVGRLEGFRFQLAADAEGQDAQALSSAALRALRGDVEARVRRFERDPDDAFALLETGRIGWHGDPVARLRPGASPLKPLVEPLRSDLLEAGLRERVRRRLTAWLDAHSARTLARLHAAAEADPGAAGRGILYQLVERLGLLPRREIADQIAALGKADRKALAALGVRIGATSVYLTGLTREPAVALRAVLWAAHEGRDAVPPSPAGPSSAAAEGVPARFYDACGYRLIGGRAVRADRLEKLAGEARRLARQGPFAVTGSLKSAAGCDGAALIPLLTHLGYRMREDQGEPSFVPKGTPRKPSKDRAGESKRKKPRPAARRSRSKRGHDPDSPFAKLKELTVSE
ncbi:MAG: helicase-related protein [Alphaproteobacteria bacterium]|nr:helicase-related protein [Alphaproteobacteria bacterium]